MGVGKNGLLLSEARGNADAIEWSPSKNQKTSHIATSNHHTSTPKQSASMGGRSAAKKIHQGQHTSPHMTNAGGGGHHKPYKSAHHG